HNRGRTVCRARQAAEVKQSEGSFLRYLQQFLWITGFTLAGEALHAALPLPIPAAVWGLALLFLALESGRLPLDSVAGCGQFLLGLMPLLFIAPAVGLVDVWPM